MFEIPFKILMMYRERKVFYSAARGLLILKSLVTLIYFELFWHTYVNASVTVIVFVGFVK